MTSGARWLGWPPPSWLPATGPWLLRPGRRHLPLSAILRAAAKSSPGSSRELQLRNRESNASGISGAWQMNRQLIKFDGIILHHQAIDSNCCRQADLRHENGNYSPVPQDSASGGEQFRHVSRQPDSCKSCLRRSFGQPRGTDDRRLIHHAARTPGEQISLPRRPAAHGQTTIEWHSAFAALRGGGRIWRRVVACRVHRAAWRRSRW